MVLSKYWQRSVGYFGPGNGIQPYGVALFAAPLGIHAALRRSDDVLLRTRMLTRMAMNVSGGAPPVAGWLSEYSALVVAHHTKDSLHAQPDPESGDPGIVQANWLRHTIVNQPTVAGNYYVFWEQDETYDTPAKRDGNPFGGTLPAVRAWLFSYDLAGALDPAHARSINLTVTCYLQTVWGSKQSA